MANPVGSFLAGFAAVDRLETNRQLRDFNKQKMSRMRTLWGREDQVWERQQLEQYRADSLVKFDATVQDIVNEVGAESDRQYEHAISLGADEETAQAAKLEYIQAYYGSGSSKNGKPTGFTSVANEALKRMIEADPAFGEHAGLSLGIDTAAGPLVNDEKPVAGIALIPPELDPAGVGGASVIANSVNGQQPVTDGRSSRPDDKVSIKQIGLSELTNMFGGGVMQNDLRVAGLIREAVGIKPTGTPLASLDARRKEIQQQQDTGAAALAGSEEQPATPPFNVQDPGRVDTEEAIRNRNQPSRATPSTASTVASDEVVGTGVTPGEDLVAFTGDPEIAQELAELIAEGTGYEAPKAPTPPRPGDPQYERPEDVTFFDSLKDSNNPVIGALATAADSVVDALSHIPGVMTYKGAESRNKFIDLSYGAANAINKVAGYEGEELSRERAAKSKAERAAKAKVDRAVEENFARNEAATKVAHVPNPKTYSANKIASTPGAAGDALLSAPLLTEEGMKSTAAAALQPVRGRQPNVIQMYNAVGLAKMKAITSAQLLNYASTGQFNEAAKRDLQLVTDSKSGITTVVDMQRGGPVSQFRTGQGTASGGDTLKQEEQIFDLQNKFLEGNWVDRDGKVIPGVRQNTMNALNTALDLLGAPKAGQPGYEVRAGRSMLNSMQVGIDMVRNFNPDYSQTFDLAFWTDPEINANNAAVGFLLDQKGVTSKVSQNKALYDYGWTYQRGTKLKADDYIQHVLAFETAADALTAQQHSKEGLEADAKWAEGMTRDEIRTELVKQALSK